MQRRCSACVLREGGRDPSGSSGQAGLHGHQQGPLRRAHTAVHTGKRGQSRCRWSPGAGRAARGDLRDPQESLVLSAAPRCPPNGRLHAAPHFPTRLSCDWKVVLFGPFHPCHLLPPQQQPICCLSAPVLRTGLYPLVSLRPACCPYCPCLSVRPGPAFPGTECCPLVLLRHFLCPPSAMPAGTQLLPCLVCCE